MTSRRLGFGRRRRGKELPDHAGANRAAVSGEGVDSTNKNESRTLWDLESASRTRRTGWTWLVDGYTTSLKPNIIKPNLQHLRPLSWPNIMKPIPRPHVYIMCLAVALETLVELLLRSSPPPPVSHHRYLRRPPWGEVRPCFRFFSSMLSYC